MKFKKLRKELDQKFSENIRANLDENELEKAKFVFYWQGVLAFMFGIMSLFFSLIPYFGISAIPFGLCGAFFCGMSYISRRRSNQGVKVVVAGMLIGLLASGIGLYQTYVFYDYIRARDEIKAAIEETGKDLAIEVAKEKVGIKTENGKLQRLRASIQENRDSMALLAKQLKIADSLAFEATLEKQRLPARVREGRRQNWSEHQQFLEENPQVKEIMKDYDKLHKKRSSKTH